LSPATAERLPFVAVTGDAGIGKSRLVQEMQMRAERQGIRTLHGSCLHLVGGQAPLAAISGSLVGMLRGMPGPQRARLLDGLEDDLEPILPVRRHHLAAAATPLPNAPLRQQRIFNALLELFERLGGHGLLLVLEDLHWADSATTDFLRFAATNAHDSLASVVTVRTEPATRESAIGQVLLDLERAGDLQRVVLGPLSVEEIGLMVENLLGRRLAAGEANLLHSRSDGNPYFAQELALAGIAGTTGIPPSLQDVLLARFAMQPVEVQSILRTLAVLGREAAEDLLLAVHGSAAREAEACLRAAVQARLIEPSTKAVDGYRYRHALMREAVYGDLLPSERRRAHRRAAMALEERATSLPRSQERAALLADHWEAGGDVGRALVARSAAAELALSAGAINDAYHHARAALNLWQPAGAASRAQTGPPGTLHLRFAVLAHGNGRFEEAQQALREAQALGVPRNVEEEVLVLDYRCNVLWALGKYDESLAAAEEAFRISPASRPELRARAHRMLAGIYYIQGRQADARECAVEGMRHALAAGDRTAERYLHWVIACCHLDSGEVERASQEAALSFHLGDDVEPLEAFVGPVNFAAFLASCGRYADLIEFASRAQEAIRHYGLEQSHGTVMGNMRLMALTRLGRLREADELLSVLDGAPDLMSDLAAERLATAAELRLRQGRLREAAELVERSHATRSDWSQEWTTANVAATEGQIAAQLGQPVAALERLAVEWGQLSARISTLRLRLLATMMQLYAESHRLRRGRDASHLTTARALNEAGRALLGEFRGRVTEWDALLVQTDAEFSRISGDGGVERWTEAVRLWDEAALPYEATYARCRLGEQLLMARRRANATAVLRDAVARASGTEAGGLTTLAAGIMTRGRLDTRQRVALPVGPYEQPSPQAAHGGALGVLSDREREVLDLVAAGMTNRQIADRLYISEKTAATHVSNILGKLQASSRAQAAAILVGTMTRDS